MGGNVFSMYFEICVFKKKQREPKGGVDDCNKKREKIMWVV